MTIKSTNCIVGIVAGEATVEGRVWIGETDGGVEVSCLITRIAIARDADATEFERELLERNAPRRAVDVFPLKMIL